jgi:hypothetical protein
MALARHIFEFFRLLSISGLKNGHCVEIAVFPNVKSRKTSSRYTFSVIFCDFLKNLRKNMAVLTNYRQEIKKAGSEVKKTFNPGNSCWGQRKYPIRGKAGPRWLW